MDEQQLSALISKTAALMEQFDRRCGAIDGRLQLFERITELVRARRQAERFGGQAADAFAIHRQACGARRRDHAHHAFGLERFEHRRGDRLDLGHDQVGLFRLDQRLELLRVGHRNGARMMCDLLTRRVFVAIDGNRLDAQSLQRDQHFAAKFASAQQHDFRRARRQRGSDSGHVRPLKSEKFGAATHAGVARKKRIVASMRGRAFVCARAEPDIGEARGDDTPGETMSPPAPRGSRGITRTRRGHRAARGGTPPPCRLRCPDSP